MFLPLSSSRNLEFLNYMWSILKKNYENSGFIQKYFQEPIIKPLAQSLKNIDEVKNSNPKLDVGQQQSDTPYQHRVILTFYVQYGNQQNLSALIDLLIENHINKAVFFIEKKYMDEHEFVIKEIQSQGYLVKIWTNLDRYDSKYPPTIFKKIPLIESDVLSKVNTDRDAIDLFRAAIHYYNSSIVIFTPKIMTHKVILEDILMENGKTIEFADSIMETGHFDATMFYTKDHNTINVISPYNSLQNIWVDAVLKKQRFNALNWS